MDAQQLRVRALPKKKHDVVFYTHFEEVLRKVNPFGPYQIFCCIVILYASIEWAGNSTFMYVLGSLEPDWNCTLNTGGYQMIKAPTDDDKCAFLKTQCKDYKASTEAEFDSVVGKFKMVCDHKKESKYIEIAQAGGSLLGSIIGGHMGDHMGRRTIFFSGQLLIIITSIMSTAATGWISFASIQGVNCFLYGVIEVTSLTMMMEYTSNKYRMILNACFQTPFAYMTMALIAYLTKDWQNYFIFLNLVSSPLTIGFMLFLESPRWLIARNQLDKACDVLNDMAHQRWNNTKAKFTTNDLSAIHKDEKKKRFYTIYHLFSTKRMAKQSAMQMLSMFTYAMVSNTYLYTVKGMHDSQILFLFFDGLFRLVMPVIIIFLDFKFTQFGRKAQFIGSLSIEAILFGVTIVLVATGMNYDHIAVTVLITVATMINDCIFWMNIVQITTQRYPTVIRCIAFGSLHGIKHVGTIIGYLALRPLLTENNLWAFIIPEIFIVFTLFVGTFLQPETKGKAMMDQMVQANYGRMENELPRALMRLAAGHKAAQMDVQEQFKHDLAVIEEQQRAGQAVHNPWQFGGDNGAFEEEEEEERHEDDIVRRGEEAGETVERM